MTKRIVPLLVILTFATAAWAVLGGTIVTRTARSDDGQREKLAAQWGGSQTQKAPEIDATNGKANVGIPLRSSTVGVDLALEQRRLGLLWYNLYTVHFHGRYVVHNDTSAPRLVMYFDLPSGDATYTNFHCTIAGKSVDEGAALLNEGVRFDLAPGARATVDIAYDSRGMESWAYKFGDGVRQVNGLDFTMSTNFAAVDFPPHTLLPSRESTTAKGWSGEWNYGSIVTGNGVGMTVPYPMQPGPLAVRITMWAPLALFFYLFVMLVITTIRNVDLHAINYFFLACAFFAFHLLFAYLIDRIPLELAFAICSVVSLFLTVSYLRLAVGWRFAAVESAFAQLVYLVLFSWALFNEGWSGLAITIGVIITLFILMQVTGRIRWSERFPDRIRAAAD